MNPIQTLIRRMNRDIPLREDPTTHEVLADAYEEEGLTEDAARSRAIANAVRALQALGEVIPEKRKGCDVFVMTIVDVWARR